MGAGAGFNLLGSNDFTLSMWLRPTAVLASTDTLIVRPFNPGIGSYNYPVMSISSSRIVFGLGSPSAIEAGSIYVNSPPLNKWTQITQTYSSSKGLITGYVDGKQVVSYTPGLGTTLGQRMQIQFGGFISGQYTGAVDDFVFYGQALTAAEIQHIYAQSAQEHGIALTEIE